MNVHTGTTAPSGGYISGLLDEGKDANWRFALGQMVTHRDQPLPSKVMLRTRTSRGVEVYGIRSYMIEDTNRDRMIFGDVLVAMADDDPAWEVCMLTGTGMDPRLVA